VLELYAKACVLRKQAVDWLSGFFKEERGATIAEYAILLAVVVVALIAVLGRLTGALEAKLEQIINGIKDVPTH